MGSKVGIGVIGLGRIGLTHLEAVIELSGQVELMAVADTNTEILQKIADRYSPRKSYSSVEDALRDPKVEAVVLALPNNLHCPVAVKAAESGRHVLVEKPMAISVKEADRMIEAAEKANVRLMVGQSRRFIPALRQSKTYLSKIGRPFSMIYLMMPFFDTSNAPGWWQSKANTGGLLFPTQGSHTLDYSFWLFDDREPVSIFAKAYSSNPSFEGDDQGTIMIEMEDGSFITNHLSINTFPPVHDCIVNCSSGTMSFSHRYIKGQPIGRSEVDSGR